MPELTGATHVRLDIPDDVPEIYVNVMQVLSSQYDLLFVFGTSRFGGAGDGGTASARAEVLVRMSPQHAKAMLQALTTVIDEQEARFGHIAMGVTSEQSNGR